MNNEKDYDDKEYNIDNYLMHYNRQTKLEKQFAELYAKSETRYVWRQLAQLADILADEDEWFCKYDNAMGVGNLDTTEVPRDSDFHFDPDEMFMFDSEQRN